VSEQQPKPESKKWHHNYWVRLGAAALVGVGLITYGSVLLGHQRTSLEDNIGSKIDPAANDIDEFMVRADGFFDDYKEFRIDICQSALGTQMQGCDQVLAEAEEESDANEDASMHSATTIVTATTTVTTTP